MTYRALNERGLRVSTENPLCDVAALPGEVLQVQLRTLLYAGQHRMELFEHDGRSKRHTERE